MNRFKESKLMISKKFFQSFQEKNGTQDLLRVRLTALDDKDCQASIKKSKLPNNTKDRFLIVVVLIKGVCKGEH